MSEKKPSPPPVEPERRTLDQPDSSKRYSENPPQRSQTPAEPKPTSEPRNS